MNEREAFIQERLRAEFARWLKWAVLAGAIIFPALTALDVVVYPAHAARFFVYRTAAAACLALTAVAAGKVLDYRAHFLLGLFAIWVSAAAIEAMILRTGGHVSPYSTGMILLVVCVLAYIPGSMLFHGLAACSMIGIYALPIIATEPIIDFRTFFLALFFLSSIIFAMLALRYLALRSFREQASALYEVRAYGDALPHAGGGADADPMAAVRRLREEIAARRSTEKLLEASEQKYRTLFESAPDAFSISDLAGNFIDGNRKTEDLTGYRRDEAIGRNFLSLNLLPLSLVPRAMKLLALNALGRATGPDEFELIAKGGHVTPVEVSTFPVTIDGKRVVLGIARDITERRRSEERLRSLSKRLEFLVSSSPAIIYTCRYGGDWAATFVSDNLRNVLGYDAQEYLDAPGFRVEGIHPDDRERVLAGLSALGAADSYEHEYRFRHKNGAYRWMFDRINVVRDEEGKPVECVGSWIDIDARKSAEEAWRESEARFRSIAETSMDVIFRLDQNGTVVYVSPSIESELGFAIHDVVGLYFLQFVHEENRNKVQESFARLVQGEPFKSIDLRVLKKTGGFIHSEINVSPILDKNNGVMEIQGVIHNITERKSAEEEVRRINQNLERIVAERTVQLEEANRILRLEVDARRRSEESLLVMKDCLESLPLGITIADTAGRIMYVNPADAEIHGHAREELIGRDIGAYAEPEGRKAKSFEEMSAGGPWKRESINVRRDGKPFPVQLMSRAVYNREGDPLGIITACEDIRAQAGRRGAPERRAEIPGAGHPVEDGPRRDTGRDDAADPGAPGAMDQQDGGQGGQAPLVAEGPLLRRARLLREEGGRLFCRRDAEDRSKAGAPACIPGRQDRGYPDLSGEGRGGGAVARPCIDDRRYREGQDAGGNGAVKTSCRAGRTGGRRGPRDQ